jgi:hypothetical protein
LVYLNTKKPHGHKQLECEISDICKVTGKGAPITGHEVEV